MVNRKYVLCRPRGGLNDTLCQIEKCATYCKKFDRTLLLDTSRSGLRDDLLFYFTFRESYGVKVLAWADFRKINALSEASTWPQELQGRIDEYETEFVKGGACVDLLSDVKIEFNRKKDYNETVLLYERCGGGANSYWLLKHFEPTKVLLNELSIRLAHLPCSYVSVHIRHTDLKTDYRGLLSSLTWALESREVFIATDSGELQQKLQDAAPRGARLFFVSKLDPTSSQRLHDTEATDRESNYQMFADLFALAFADKLYFTLTTGRFFSGFSGLALALKYSVLSRRIAKAIGREAGSLPKRAKFLFWTNRVWWNFTKAQGAMSVAKVPVRLVIQFRERYY